MNINNLYICNGEKYICKGETISLPVTFSSLPEIVNVENYKLLRKTTFHVSLVCIGKIIERYNVAIPQFKEKVINDFCEFIKDHDVSLSSYSHEFRFVSQNERRAIITMCEINHLEEFFELINKKYNLAIESHPTHVTLYTLQPDVGIFVIDQKDLKELTRVIVPELPILP